MRFPEEVSTDVHNRLRRIEGQVRGLQRLIDEGAECRDIVTQLSAVQSAVQKVGFRLVSAGMQHCVNDPQGAAESGMTTDELERLFMKLS
jgi:DNA-binding FrmR family transcriptional regulator